MRRWEVLQAFLVSQSSYKLRMSFCGASSPDNAVSLRISSFRQQLILLKNGAQADQFYKCPPLLFPSAGALADGGGGHPMRIGDRSLASVLRPGRFLGSYQLGDLSAKYSLYPTGVCEDETFSTQTVSVYFSVVFPPFDSEGGSAQALLCRP